MLWRIKTVAASNDAALRGSAATFASLTLLWLATRSYSPKVVPCVLALFALVRQPFWAPTAAVGPGPQSTTTA